MPAEISIIVPTFSERDNVGGVCDALDRALSGIDWEVVFVDDDSPDGTAERIAEIARADPRVRLVRRVGRRGLASACIEGMLASTAPWIAVMDADHQHDERILPAMLAALKAGDCDIVVASRYIGDGGVGEWSAGRRLISRLTTRVGRLVLRASVSDPMSGFFALRRDFFESIVKRLSGVGFKILLDILASAPPLARVREIPYVFRERRHGQSKLDTLIAWEFLMLLVDKGVGRFVPVRFVAFVMNGAVGAALHLGVLALFYFQADVGFAAAQVIATWVAMTNNFFLNNLLTYRDRRFRGLAVLRGLAGFYLACGVGAVANVGVAIFLFGYGVPWYAAGFLGMVVGAVWNYAVTSTLLWRFTPGR